MNAFRLVAALAVIGAALPAVASDAPKVEKCDAELGTLAVAEPQDHVTRSLSRYKLGSPSAMLRMIAQESGCFAVVERGVGMQNMQQERALAARGQLQADANVGGGQLQAADFVMTAAVQFSEDTGGVGGAVGGLLNKAGGVLGQLGGLAGGVQFREAETTLLVADVRSGIQVASAEGKASRMNFSLGGWGWGGLGWAAAGGYSKTPEGKLIAASLLDNFNKIVLNVRDKKLLVRATSQASRNNAAASIQATGTTPGAVQPIATAAMTPRALPGGALPSGLAGAFTGQFGGAERGIFSVIVGTDGRVSGVGQSSAGASFNVTGIVSSNGSVVMTSTGQAGNSQFSGVIDPSSGALVGTWQSAANNAQGTFNGKRQ
jgi:hypothetical protein